MIRLYIFLILIFQTLVVSAGISFDKIYSSDRKVRAVDFIEKGGFVVAEPRGAKQKYFKILKKESGEYVQIARVCCSEYSLGLKFVKYKDDWAVVHVSIDESLNRIRYKIYSLSGSLLDAAEVQRQVSGNARHVLMSRDTSRAMVYLFDNGYLLIFNVNKLSTSEGYIGDGIYTVGERVGYFLANEQTSQIAVSNPADGKLHICKTFSPYECFPIKDSRKGIIRKVVFVDDYLVVPNGSSGFALYRFDSLDFGLNFQTGYLPDNFSAVQFKQEKALLVGANDGVYAFEVSTSERLGFQGISAFSQDYDPSIRLIEYIAVEGELYSIWENGSVVNIRFQD